MSFFNDDFYKQLGKEIDVEDDDTVILGNNTIDQNTNYYPNNVDLEVNKKNQEAFNDLMDNASVKTDDYWDFNSPIVKIVLIALFVIIVLGLLYYIIGWIILSGK